MAESATLKQELYVPQKQTGMQLKCATGIRHTSLTQLELYLGNLIELIQFEEYSQEHTLVQFHVCCSCLRGYILDVVLLHGWQISHFNEDIILHLVNVCML